MRSGWGLFLLLPWTQRSKSAASGPLYFAWGCFRDFLSRPLPCTAEGTLMPGPGHEKSGRENKAHSPCTNSRLAFFVMLGP
jgi:hypothetical protein